MLDRTGAPRVRRSMAAEAGGTAARIACRARVLVAGVSIGLGAVGATWGTAQANGRFPQANQLVKSPTDPTRVALRATFGLLWSRDSGQSFHWICEEANGFVNGSDPGVAIMADGSLSVAGFFGLARTSDEHCSYQFVGGALEKQYTVDIAAYASDPKSAVLVTATQSAGSAFVQVFETNDNGKTWSPVGVPVGSDVIATTVEVADTRRERLYVGGSVVQDGKRRGVIARSDDRGATWQRTYIDNITTLFVSGVDPVDPDIVYIRTFATPEQSLLVSKDGGVAFANAVTFPSRMLGFAISPDGSRVAVGGPSGGLHIGSRDTLVFEKKSTLPLTCLKWYPEALYACGDQDETGFVLARTTDDGANWTTMLRSLSDIQPPPDWCGPTADVPAVCNARWPVQKAIFDDPWGRNRDAGADAATDGGQDAGPKPPPLDDCDCRSTPGGITPAGARWLWVTAVAIVLATLRRLWTGRRRRP